MQCFSIRVVILNLNPKTILRGSRNHKQGPGTRRGDLREQRAGAMPFAANRFAAVGDCGSAVENAM